MAQAVLATNAVSQGFIATIHAAQSVACTANLPYLPALQTRFRTGGKLKLVAHRSVTVSRNARSARMSSELVDFNQPKAIEKDNVPAATSEWLSAEDALLSFAAALTPFLLDVESAHAVGGELGLLEGKSVALIHPAAMLTLAAVSGYTAYLGFRWRRTRTIPDEINALKKQLPAVATEGAPPSETELAIKALTEERKDLVKQGFRDRHFNIGSVLLGSGVVFSIAGALNTFWRTGKLFPGPHLWAGAGITALWAAAAALVPAMQKGDDTARSLHIALNVINLALFVWQIPTGLEIVAKVWEFAPWP
eukprot:jgi/Mesen1/6832/ME000351S05949